MFSFNFGGCLWYKNSKLSDLYSRLLSGIVSEQQSKCQLLKCYNFLTNSQFEVLFSCDIFSQRERCNVHKYDYMWTLFPVCSLLDPRSGGKWTIIAKKKKNCHLYWLWKNVIGGARARASSSLAKILTFWSILAMRFCFNDVILESNTNDQLTYLPGHLKARENYSRRNLSYSTIPIKSGADWNKQINKPKPVSFSQQNNKILYQPNETKTVLTNRKRPKSFLLKKLFVREWIFQRSGWDHTTCLKIDNTAN